jgi:hypothetical protein
VGALRETSSDEPTDCSSLVRAFATWIFADHGEDVRLEFAETIGENIAGALVDCEESVIENQLQGGSMQLTAIQSSWEFDIATVPHSATEVRSVAPD